MAEVWVPVVVQVDLELVPEPVFVGVGANQVEVSGLGQVGDVVNLVSTSSPGHPPKSKSVIVVAPVRLVGVCQCHLER